MAAQPRPAPQLAARNIAAQRRPTRRHAVDNKPAGSSGSRPASVGPAQQWRRQSPRRRPRRLQPRGRRPTLRLRSRRQHRRGGRRPQDPARPLPALARQWQSKVRLQPLMLDTSFPPIMWKHNAAVGVRRNRGGWFVVRSKLVQPCSMHGRLRPSISLRNSSFLGQDRVAPAPLAAPGLLLAALPLRSKLTVQTGFVHPSRLLAAGPTERQFQASSIMRNCLRDDLIAAAQIGPSQPASGAHSAAPYEGPGGNGMWSLMAVTRAVACAFAIAHVRHVCHGPRCGPYMPCGVRCRPRCPSPYSCYSLYGAYGPSEPDFGALTLMPGGGSRPLSRPHTQPPPS